MQEVIFFDTRVRQEMRNPRVVCWGRGKAGERTEGSLNHDLITKFMFSKRESSENVKERRNYFFVVIVVIYLPASFHTKGPKEWNYSFNPCVSFKEGSSGNCQLQSDVAVSLLATVGN